MSFSLSMALFLCGVMTAHAAPVPVLSAWSEAAPMDKPAALPPDSDQSLIPWRGLDVDAWLDVGSWMRQRAWRDATPDWRAHERQYSAQELVGKVISCVGECRLFRGKVSHRVRWLSRVHEGDELHTGPDGYLWMMLADGALVRLAPRTAVGFLEIAVAPDRVFFHARLGQGLVYWLPRSGRRVKLEDLTETDQLFLPVMDVGANVESFRRAVHAQGDDAARLARWVGRQDSGVIPQREELNRLIGENNPSRRPQSHVTLLVAPNGSVLTHDMPVAFFFPPGGRGYLKADTRDVGEEADEAFRPQARFLFRGYQNTEEMVVPPGEWHEVAADGRALFPPAELPPLLAASELPVKRVPTLMLVRERWLSALRGFDAEAAKKPEVLAPRWGYQAWTAEALDKRLAFLKEHTRRMETTNLRSLQRLQGTPDETFDGRYFATALESYFRAIKRRHAAGPASVPDMSDLHFYGWVLINAKQQ